MTQETIPIMELAKRKRKEQALLSYQSKAMKKRMSF